MGYLRTQWFFGLESQKISGFISFCLSRSSNQSDDSSCELCTYSQAWILDQWSNLSRQRQKTGQGPAVIWDTLVQILYNSLDVKKQYTEWNIWGMIFQKVNHLSPYMVWTIEAYLLISLSNIWDKPIYFINWGLNKISIEHIFLVLTTLLIVINTLLGGIFKIKIYLFVSYTPRSYNWPHLKIMEEFYICSFLKVF